MVDDLRGNTLLNAGTMDTVLTEFRMAETWCNLKFCCEGYWELGKHSGITQPRMNLTHRQKYMIGDGTTAVLSCANGFSADTLIEYVRRSRACHLWKPCAHQRPSVLGVTIYDTSTQSRPHHRHIATTPLLTFTISTVYQRRSVAYTDSTATPRMSELGQRNCNNIRAPTNSQVKG